MTPESGGGIAVRELAAWGGSLALAALVLGILHRAMKGRVRTLERAYHGALEIMSRLIDSVDRHSSNHSRRVAESSIEIAQALGLHRDEVEDVRIGALLHDIGGLDIPAEALAKAAGLSKEEMDDVGRFARSGGRPGGEHPPRRVEETLRRVLPMVTCHTERWDGTGQRALKDREIPLGARIIAVADAYDSMVTDRAYRKGCTPEEALALLREARGKQFDPLVVDVFVQLHAAPVARAAAA